MPTPYVYSPFAKPRHIRLLQVWLDCQLRSGVEEAPPRIKGRFAVTNLDNLRHSFRAISYVWGDAIISHKIWMGDSTYIGITRSANEVLTWITANGFDDYIWIDGICMNQDDLEERSSQVRLMWDVYSRAAGVVAWMGCSSDDTGPALNLLSVLYRGLVQLEEDDTTPTTSNLTKIQGCHWPSTGWVALTRFLNRPYFLRAWILQETVAAKQIRMQWGEHMLDWGVLSYVVSAISTAGMRLLIEPNQTGMAPAVESMMNATSLRFQVNFSGAPPPFSHVVSICQSFKSTNPRDKVYALLNMTIEAKDDHLVPDLMGT